MGHPGKFGDSESPESMNKKFELNVINQQFSKAVTQYAILENAERSCL